MTGNSLWAPLGFLFDEAKKPSEEEEYRPPSYRKPGWLIVEIYYVDPSACSTSGRYELDVLDYAADSAVYWIQEGEGFDYWVGDCVDVELPGVYLIEGICGEYHRGDWSWGEDDDVTWYWESCRRLTTEECIKLTGCAPEGGYE